LPPLPHCTSKIGVRWAILSKSLERPVLWEFRSTDTVIAGVDGEKAVYQTLYETLGNDGLSKIGQSRFISRRWIGNFGLPGIGLLTGLKKWD
jgi:hypothetical protein